MILLSVSDSLQVLNSKTDWMQGVKIFELIIGAIVGILTIYWIIYQIKQAKKKKRPEFIISSNKEGLALFANGNPRKLETTLTIINRGEKAYIENVEFDNKSMKDDTTLLMNKMIMKDKGIQLKFSPIQPYDSYKECLIKFKLIYTDGEGNKYYQNIDGKFDGQPNISKPIEM